MMTIIIILSTVVVVQAKLQRPELWNDIPLDYNRSWPYNKRLGFHVAIDAAARLPRNLPVAAVFSLSPPGDGTLSPLPTPFYHQIMKVACVLCTHRWACSAMHFQGRMGQALPPHTACICQFVRVGLNTMCHACSCVT